MRRTPLGLFVAGLFAAFAGAANNDAAFDPVVAAAVQHRWPGALSLIQKRLEEKPDELSQARPAVAAALGAGARFVGAERRFGATTAKTDASRDFRSALDALGPARGRYLSREGGLGVVALDVLGARDLAAVLGGAGGAVTSGLASVRAEALYKSGRYEAATVQAREALRLDPGDKDAFAILKLSEGRSAPSGADSGAGARAAPRPAAAAAPDSRPALLAVKVSKSATAVPELEAGGEPRRYVSPGTRKLNVFDRVWNEMVIGYATLNRNQSAADRARLRALRRELDGIETGRGVVDELGGWKEIEKKVDLRMADLPGGTMGLAIPRATPDAEGHTVILLISRATAEDPDAVTVSVFAHELSHVGDFARGDVLGGLEIPSELAAHRLQVHAFLEMAARMTPAEKKAASGNHSWEYMNFIARLWVDHILEKYHDSAEFRRSFASSGIGTMANEAYMDLQRGKVSAGTPQLDYHLTAAKGGLYTTVTDEKDILDVVGKKKSNGVEPTAAEKELLKRRQELMMRADLADAEYRSSHGYELNGAR